MESTNKALGSSGQREDTYKLMSATERHRIYEAKGDETVVKLFTVKSFPLQHKKNRPRKAGDGCTHLR